MNKVSFIIKGSTNTSDKAKFFWRIQDERIKKDGKSAPTKMQNMTIRESYDNGKMNPAVIIVFRAPTKKMYGDYFVFDNREI